MLWHHPDSHHDFGQDLIPAMVASTRLVLTTGRRFCERFVRAAAAGDDGGLALAGGSGVWRAGGSLWDYVL